VERRRLRLREEIDPERPADADSAAADVTVTPIRLRSSPRLT
jgi:hypothetical protein